MAKNNTPTATGRRRTTKQSAPLIADGVTIAATTTEAADRTAGDTVTHEPSYDDIARTAYQRYLSRGGVDGGDFDDWVEAERELRSRR